MENTQKPIRVSRKRDGNLSYLEVHPSDAQRFRTWLDDVIAWADAEDAKERKQS